MSKKPTLLLPEEYVKDATAAIREAKRRVSFLCMMITDDEATDEFIEALNEASLRGVHVEVAADVFTYGELSGHFIPTGYFSKQSRATTNMARHFQKSNVIFNWLGRFANTPFTGRTHIKWCVVDDAIYAFGGVNLYEKGIMNNDYMIKVTDPQLANQLDDEYERLVRADQGRFAYRSRSIPSPIGTVHIDGGLPLDSIIYRRVCSLAKDASSVLYVSQYSPTGKLNRYLKQTESFLYFNTLAGASPLSKVVIRILEFLTHNKTLYKHSSYLHAKFMIFTMPDGKKIAVTGSHNFVHGGVLLGTREVALETEDKGIIKQLEEFYSERIA
jgi:cardiolipin synthase A/B